MTAEVGAIRARVVLDEERESVALKQAGILGEEAKQDADEKAFEIVTGIAALFEGVVQFTEQLDGSNIDRIFHVELMLLVARNECKGIDVAMKLIERKFGGDAFF